MMIDLVNKSLRKKWEQRALENKTELKGVLLQGLPIKVNFVINEWHNKIISRYVLSKVPKGGRVLDLGCGYGRITEKIRISRPDIEIIGMDFSYLFCRLYSDIESNVVCGDVQCLSFREKSFDAIIGITVLMYIESSQLQQVLEGILKLLKPEGCFLSIEPGQEFMSLIGKVHPKSKKKTTGGSGMTKQEYLELYPFSAGTLTGGARLLSLFLPVWVLTARILDRIPFKNIVVNFDLKISGANRYCIHRWIVITRTRDDMETIR
jgi:SAM-dependent methyltransferase